MKFNLKPMELLGNLLTISAVFALLGGVAYSAGWVVDRAGANEMVTQSVYQEALDRERADLQFQLDMATMKLRLLSEKSDRSDFDEMEVSLLKDQISRLQLRLEELNSPTA